MNTSSNRNDDIIKRLIASKVSTTPSYVTVGMIPMTDNDHHPYTRWWRGNYASDKPIVMDRIAGFRRNKQECYKGNYYTPDITDSLRVDCAYR